MRGIIVVLCAASAIACGEVEPASPTTTVVGKLVEAETGRPLAGRVTVQPDLGFVLTSTGSGVFRFDGAAYGTRYRLTGEASGFEVLELEYTPRVSSERELSLELVPAVVCSPGQRRCAPDGEVGVETCDGDGRGFQFSACASGELCEAGACLASGRLRVEVAGRGAVVSRPAAVVCSSDCSTTLPLGAKLTLEAQPYGDTAFVGWSGDCAGADPVCALSVGASSSVGAEFRVSAYRLSLSIRGGTGRVTSVPSGLDCADGCSGFFEAGAQVTLTAAPGAGFELRRWEGACSGSSPSCTVTMSQARSVTARFQRPGIPLDVSLEGDGVGTVTSDPAGIDCGVECSAGFDSGEQVTLTAAPAEGSVFQGWGGACAAAGMSTECELTLSAARAVTARFDGDSVELAVELQGSGAGRVTSDPAGIDCGATCTGRFARGSTVELRASAEPGHDFWGWSGACAAAGENSVCTPATDADRRAQARFEPSFLSPLGADPACVLGLDFEAPDRYSNRCGLGEAMGGAWSATPSRNARLGDAIEGTGPLDTGTSLPGALPVTVELSVRPDTIPATLIANHSSGDPLGFELRALGDGRLVATSFDGVGGVSSATTTQPALASNQWAHVAVVLDASGMELWVEGSSEAQLTGTPVWAATASTAWIGGTRGLFSGRVDEVRISDTPRYP